MPFLKSRHDRTFAFCLKGLLALALLPACAASGPSESEGLAGQTGLAGQSPAASGQKLLTATRPHRLSFTPDCTYPKGSFLPESCSQVAYKPESAWTNMAPWAFWTVAAARPSVVVELGSHNGYSTFAFAQAIAETGQKAHVYAVDTWEGDAHAGFYDDSTYQAVRAHAQVHYKDSLSLMRMTFDEALGHIADGSVDLLHIDGLHHYENVKHDFETWLPKMSPRGVVLFHDIDITASDFGVYQFWAEITATYPSFAFHQGPGLGILGVGHELPDALSTLFEARDTPMGACVHRIYEQLGEATNRWDPQDPDKISG